MPRDKRGEKPEWYPLDNAGVLYSALQKEKYSAIYRFSAVMAERVDRDALQRAVDKTMPRFPSFGVRIKKGAFWYYFEPNSAPGPFVKEDISNPCQPVRFREDNGWLVRFYYYEKRISVEVFHAVSDGGGALVFFKTLLAVYLRELGYSIPNTHGILDVAEEPRRAEREDAYGRYATVRPRREKRGKKAYQNNGTAEPFYTFNVTMGFCSVARLKEKARGYGVSITEYLTAVLLKVIADKQHRERPRRERPVALAIPINLRGWFPSETLRNFILTVRPSMTATQLFVVPRSIPMILLINEVSSQKNLFISCLDVKRMSIFKTPAGLCGFTRPPRRSRGGRSCRPACSLSGTP